MEILHKAKRISFNNNIHGKWVEGYYIYHIKRTPCVIGDCVKPEDEVHMIAYDGFSDWNMPRDIEQCIIDPETLCRYIGLKDRHKQMLWEHDIVTIAGEDGYFHIYWEEDRGIAVFGCCCGMSSGDSHTDYLSEMCVSCPHLVLCDIKER